MSSTDGLPTSDRQRLRCFVIGPIGSRLAGVGTPERRQYEEAIEVLEEVILPACAAVGLAEPVRADGLARAGEITEQIFRRLREDDVVIADLTGANANVMYELGLRHTRNMLTVQIGERERLPFDVTVIRTIMFNRTPHGLVTARDELIQILESGLTGRYDPVTATRIWNETYPEPSSPGTALETEPSSAAEVDEGPGFMDLIAQGEENQQPLSEAIVAIGQRLSELGSAAARATEETSQSDARGGGMRGRLAVAREYAARVDLIAENLEADVARYEFAMAHVSAANLALIERLEQDPAQLQEGMDLGRLLRRLAAQSREGIESQRGFIEVVNQSANATQVVRGPARRVVTALGRFATAAQAMDEWDRRLQALGVPMPRPDWQFPGT
jgi:hypothetical protein